MLSGTQRKILQVLSDFKTFSSLELASAISFFSSLHFTHFTSHSDLVWFTSSNNHFLALSTFISDAARSSSFSSSSSSSSSSSASSFQWMLWVHGQRMLKVVLTVLRTSPLYLLVSHQLQEPIDDWLMLTLTQQCPLSFRHLRHLHPVCLQHPALASIETQG